MRRTALALLALALAALAAGPALAEEPPGRWEILSTATIGADRFLAAHPEWDGRGVLIAVCDSGVSLGLPGLLETSDGKPKILDARELSDEGKITLEKAERASDARGNAVHGKGGRWLYGIDGLEPALPTEGEILIGYFTEEGFQNNQVADLNNNGAKNDVFGLVAFKPSGAADDDDWVAFLDRNADGDLADEQPLHDYAHAQESFHLGGHDPHAAADLVAYALNLWPDDKEAALFFDGNGHGTHVAGCAAGFGINGQEGYNGIAPGAQILALKIGNCSLAGGATTPGSMVRAWRYAVEKAEELEMPLVIQMSYGIGSEHEGTAEAERLINQLLAEHPKVAATVSAGNEGPGLSTIGLPAAADEVLAVGAAFARTTAELIYGISWPEDRMFSFSSRGGELAKPEIVAPGFEASSVPDWGDGNDVYRGTSMASPQAAGAVALLYSAALAADVPVRRDLLRAALTRTARELPGYGPLDQGPGMVDVPRAWEAYRELGGRDRWDPVTYSVTTESPAMASGSGPAVFYRGDFYPRGDLRHRISVKAVFDKDAPEAAIKRFYRTLDLECAADWLTLDKPSTYLKQQVAATIPIAFRADRLQRPGLYQTRIEAYDGELDRAERSRLGAELSVPVAVVVPHRLTASGRLAETTPAMEASMVERVFVRLAESTASLTVEVELPRAEQERQVQASLFDPEGRETSLGTASSSSPILRTTLGGRALSPGVWELALWGHQSNRGPVRADWHVLTMPAVTALPDRVELDHQAGAAPTGTLRLVTALDQIWRGTASGSVMGAVRTTREEVAASDFSYAFTLAPEEAGVDFELELEAEDWGLLTDLAVLVTDEEGHALERSGFTYRRLSLGFTPPAGAEPGATYTLKLVAALADPDLAKPKWKVEIRELRRYAEPVAVTVQPAHGEKDGLTLYPDHEAALALELATTPPARPDGFAWLAALELRPDDGRLPGLALELELF